MANEGFMPSSKNLMDNLPPKLPGLRKFYMAGQWLFPGGGLPPAGQSGKDSSDVSKYLGAILKNEYQVVYAENGKMGYDKAVSIIPDVILSDVMMPVMDGIEMLEKVKGDFRISHIPVVM